MDRAGLEEILKQELSGKKDSAGRGEWTLDHCRRTARLAVALRVAAGKNRRSTTCLDDLDLHSKLLAGHQIRPDSSKGLSEEDAARAVKMLNMV